MLRYPLERFLEAVSVQLNIPVKELRNFMEHHSHIMFSELSLQFLPGEIMWDDKGFIEMTRPLWLYFPEQLAVVNPAEYRVTSKQVSLEE